MKDCELIMKIGEEPYPFSFKDIDKAIRYAFEKNITYIKTPYGVLSLISKEDFEIVENFEDED